MDNIALICVLYRPGEECLRYWAGVSAAMPHCIFVDNTPEVAANCAAALPDGIYIPLKENRGIATAQNVGIARARDVGARYVVFFDQDSRFELSLVATLCREFVAIQNSGTKIGAIGPLIFDAARGELYKGNKSANDAPQPVATLISSGTFTSLDVLDDVGGMADKLFIDSVDHEWCWRANSRGYQIYKSGKAILPHKVGSRTIKLFGLPFLIAAPFRYYYQYRNFLLLSKLNYAPRNRIVKGTLRKFVELFFVPWFTAHPLQTIKYMFKGLYAGLHERL
jgi:rhamnosyltransferase